MRERVFDVNKDYEWAMMQSSLVGRKRGTVYGGVYLKRTNPLVA